MTAPSLRPSLSGPSLGIGGQMLLAFGGVILVSLATQWLTLQQVGSAARTTADANHAYEAIIALQDAQQAVAQQNSAVSNFLVSTDPAFLPGYRTLGPQAFAAAMARARGLSPDAPADLDRIDTALTRWRARADRDLQIMSSSPDTQTLTAELSQAIQAAIQGQRERQALRAAEQSEALARAERLSIGGTLIAALVSLAAWFGLNRVITAPLRRIGGALSRLAAGDLQSLALPRPRTREIGTLAQAVAAYRDSLIETGRLSREQAQLTQTAEADRRRLLHGLIADFEVSVQSSLTEATEAAALITRGAQAVATMMREAEARGHEVTEATDASFEDIRAIAAAGEQLSAAITDIRRRAGEAVAITAEAAREASAAQTQIAALAQQSAAIGAIVQLIATIADQTNLLALNATIEALARFPGAGGFAVVAQEVKTLAAQTSQATDHITAQVTEIQHASRRAVAGVQSVATVIDRVGTLCESVAGAVGEQNGATQDIARSIARAADLTHRVSSNIGLAATAMSDASRAADLQSDTAERLNASFTALTDNLAYFVRRSQSA